MSATTRDRYDDAAGGGGAPALVARALTAHVRSDRRVAAAIDDLFLRDADRLDDGSRARLTQVLRATVDAIERDLRERAARASIAAGCPGDVAVLAEVGATYDRLVHTGALREPALIAELIGGTTEDMIAGRLAPAGPNEADRPSLLARLRGSANAGLAEPAGALLLAGSRRGGAAALLPADLHHRLAWSIAAALRDGAGEDGAGLDRALIEATRANLARHDEGARAEAAAMRLALAIDAHADELPPLLLEAIGDRRLSLFVALLAQALTLRYEDARTIALDPAGDRLWLVLRALDLPRAAMARIGLALVEADPRRDTDALADGLDAVAAIPPEEAMAAIAPLRLDPDYRAALLALAGAGRHG